MKQQLTRLLKASKVELSLKDACTNQAINVVLFHEETREKILFRDKENQFLLEFFVNEDKGICYISYHLTIGRNPTHHLLSMRILFSLKERDYLTFNNDTPFWTTPYFLRNNQDFKDDIRLFYFFDRSYYSVFSLSNDSFRSVFRKGGLQIDFFNQNVELITDIVIISKGKSFDSSYKNLLSSLRKKELLLSPSVKEKTFPKSLNGLGYATWNAFYRDFNEEKIYALLNEFSQKGIHLDFLLLDDGWSEVDDDYHLLSFKEDPKKFPHGLKEFVSNVKKKYGIKHVGVWHSLNGYWNGVRKENFPDFTFYENEEGNSFVNLDCEEAFKFYDSWYRYLKGSGIDFVKVDNQSGYFFSFFKDRDKGKERKYLTSLINLKKALEKAIEKHFGNNLINCMEMDFDIMNNTSLGLERNSGDYAPDNPKDLKRFLMENIYNSLYHSKTAPLDYDMFLTNRSFPEINAIVRMLSGGPIYVTDEPEKIKKDIIDMLYTDGKILRMRRNLRPTYDVMYKLNDSPIKCFNDFNHKYAFLSIGVNPEGIQKTTFRLSDLHLTGEYIVHDFLKKKYFKMTNDDILEYSLKYGEFLLLSLYPLKNGQAVVGDPNSILEILSKNTHKVCL